MRVKKASSLVWMVCGVAHWLDLSGPVPVLMHGTADVKRGWFSPPDKRLRQQFRRDMLKAGYEVYYG